MRARRYTLLGIALLALLVLAQPSITVSPEVVALGGTVTISITGMGEENCAIEIVDPTGAQVFVKEITLSAGTGSVTWSVPLTARVGTYTVHVGCEVSGKAAKTFSVTAPVGGEARRDLTPLVIVALALATATATALMIKKR